MANYGRPEYWEERYQRDHEQFDWYQTFQGIGHVIINKIPQDSKVLNIGCGNSTLSEEMYKRGYQQTMNIDISPTVVKQMQDKYKEDCPLMKYQVMDVRKMDFKEGSFDAVIDKGTLDTILCGEKSAENAKLMLNEVHRVLTPTGIYICVSYMDPGKREEYLKADNFKWTMIWEKVPKPIVSQGPPGSKEEAKLESKEFHYIYILKKQEEVPIAKTEDKVEEKS